MSFRTGTVPLEEYEKVKEFNKKAITRKYGFKDSNLVSSEAISKAKGG